MTIRSIPSKRLSGAIALVLSYAVSQSALAAPPASGSAYFTDAQSSHVEDATSKGIGTVNMIACIMSAMKPDQLVNKGDYIALVDETKCDPNSRSSTSQSSGSGSGAQSEFMTAVVNSTRATNNDPMLSKIWINQVEDGETMTIFVRTSASAAPTVGNPYGVFRLDFCGHPDAISSPLCMMRGYVDAQAGSLSFYQEESGDGGGDRSSTTALQLTSVGTGTGSGKLSRTETQASNTATEAFAFAYDQDHFLRGDQCFSRDASDPETGLSVWRYGLYDAVSGDRVTRNSGFPIEYAADGKTHHGYLGYWGLQLPPDAGVVANGATVNKVDYGTGNNPTSTAYTVVKSDGKLTKYTRKGTTLDKLDKIKLNTFVNNVTGFFSGAQPNTQYELYWDNVAGNFKVTGQVNCGGNGCQTQTLPSEQPVAATFFANQGGLQGWSQALGGEVFVKIGGMTGTIDSTSVVVNYRVQDIVYPEDMPATLFCVNSCPTATTMSAYFAPGSSALSPFTPATNNNWNPTALGNVVTYTSDAINAVLRDNSASAVTFTNASALQSRPQFMNGVRTGRLFTTLSDAECSTGSGTYCDYKVNEADVYYQWETGANNWNQFAAVKDSGGNVVHFDAPLQVNYTVPSGVQYGQYAGKTIVLQYGGFGDLWGIPGACVSRLTNQPLSCENEDARYVPEFVIPMSDTTGVVTAGSTQYLVKWLDREIRFARKNLSSCSTLTAPTDVTLPTASTALNPADPASSAYIGVKPTVTGAPRVIHGDVKY
jgi:hypothetical protein